MLERSLADEILCKQVHINAHWKRQFELLIHFSGLFGLKKRQIRDDIIDLHINDNGCYEARKKPDKNIEET